MLHSMKDLEGYTIGAQVSAGVVCIDDAGLDRQNAFLGQGGRGCLERSGEPLSLNGGIAGHHLGQHGARCDGGQ